MQKCRIKLQVHKSATQQKPNQGTKAGIKKINAETIITFYRNMVCC